MTTVIAGDGVKLYAEACGEGPAVLFSCALCTTRENYRPQVGPLVEAGYRVVIWDYRGHGRSESPDGPGAYTMERVVDDLGCVLDWAAPGQAAVLGGLSFGGLASLHFALAHPGRVRALLLIDSGPGFKNPEAQARWTASIERVAGFVETRGLESFVERAAATAVGLRPELPATRAAAAAIVDQNPSGLAHFARRIAGPAAPVIDDLHRIEVPALVIVGEKDEPFLRAAEVMTARLPAAERFTVPRAGHMVNIEESEVFNAAVLRFLAGLPPLEAR
jgi:pimeloyl-ACP methyl ester carboxylesterase